MFELLVLAAGQPLELSGWLAHAEHEVFKRAGTAGGRGIYVKS